MNSTIQAPVATLLWNAVNHSIFRYFNQDLKLLGGDWNHGILNDFPETVGNGMSWSQLTIRHIFQRGRRKTTNQFSYHGPLIVDIPIKDSDFPVKPPIFDGEINYKCWFSVSEADRHQTTWTLFQGKFPELHGRGFIAKVVWFKVVPESQLP